MIQSCKHTFLGKLSSALSRLRRSTLDATPSTTTTSGPTSPPDLLEGTLRQVTLETPLSFTTSSSKSYGAANGESMKTSSAPSSPSLPAWRNTEPPYPSPPSFVNTVTMHTLSPRSVEVCLNFTGGTWAMTLTHDGSLWTMDLPIPVPLTNESSPSTLTGASISSLLIDKLEQEGETFSQKSFVDGLQRGVQETFACIQDSIRQGQWKTAALRLQELDAYLQLIRI